MIEKGYSVLKIVLVLALTFLFLDEIAIFFSKIGGSFDTKSFSFNLGFSLFCLLILLAYRFFWIKKYIQNKRLGYIIFYSSFLYFLLRIGVSENIFFISLYKGVKYCDIFLLIALLHFISLNIFFYQKKTIEKRVKPESFFLEDTLHIEGEIDNEKILQKLIISINDFKPEVAFSIGLNAVWGYGKSSFLKRFHNEYAKKNDSSIIFWCHIWKNKGSVAIIENFFEELKSALKPYSAEIANDINKYVDAVLSLSNSELNKLISAGKNFLSESKTLEEYHKHINDNIKLIDKQVVILLDDLDRLEKNEILSTLKLIRTLSDFNNVIFIAGYDRKYVVDTIDRTKDNYLDKIFNVEINLLSFDFQLLEDELLRSIDKVFPEVINDTDIDSFNTGFKRLFVSDKLSVADVSLRNIIGEQSVCTNYVLSYKDFFKTYRDVKRFLNEFKFNATINDIEINVISKEYILLKLLTFKYRQLQNLIFDNIDDILKKGQWDSENEKVQYFDNSLSNDIYVYNDDVKAKVENILKVYFSKEDIEIINAGLCRLFGVKSNNYYQRNLNSITKILHTNIYLRNNILGAEITISELQEAFNKSKMSLIADKIVKSNSQSKFTLQNELKQFILNNPPKKKEQFVDSLESINILNMNLSFSESQKIVDLLNFGFIEFYEKNIDAFKKAMIEFLKKDYIGFIDNLLSDLKINIERKESNIEYGSGILNYKNSPFSPNELKEILLSKLRYLIYKKANVREILYAYHLHTEKIVLDKKILRSHESNENLRKDIKERFQNYFGIELFEFMRANLKEHDLDFYGFQPNDFFAQIFSKKTSNLNVISDPKNLEVYNKYINEGWDNFNAFIQSLDVTKLNLSEEREIAFNKGKALVQAFIDNDYKALTKEKYLEIWNKPE